MCFETRCVMALQDHPRSLILAPIKSAYVTSYWWSIVTLFLSSPVSEILQVSGERNPTPIPPEFWGVPFGLDCRCCGSRSEDPKLIICVIDFKVVQFICSAYINVTDRRTDRQTDGRTTYDSNTALAQCALRGKKLCWNSLNPFPDLFFHFKSELFRKLNIVLQSCTHIPVLFKLEFISFIDSPDNESEKSDGT